MVRVLVSRKYRVRASIARAKLGKVAKRVVSSLCVVMVGMEVHTELPSCVFMEWGGECRCVSGRYGSGGCGGVESENKSIVGSCSAAPCHKSLQNAEVLEESVSSAMLASCFICIRRGLGRVGSCV